MQDILNTARKALFLDLAPEEALSSLTPYFTEPSTLSYVDQRASQELAGLAYAALKQYDTASECFMNVGNYYQCGYYQMLKGNLEATSNYWRPLVLMRPNHWCITLFGLVTNQLKSFPTVLQIRNHLEADIMHLARANQPTMVDNILKHLDFLANTNFESYKFAGRALFHVNQLDRAAPLLLHGQKTLPNDPEIYYHLGQYYNAVRQYEEARLVLNQCLLITPSYVPAQRLLEKLPSH